MRLHHEFKLKYVLYMLLLVSLCLTSGCKTTDITQEENSHPTSAKPYETEETNSTSVSPTVHTPEVKIHPLPTENVFIADTYSYRCPASMGGYYFCNAKHIRYQTIGGSTATPLCLQPGCKHADEACEAYMGGSIKEMAEYKGKLYASIETDNGSIELVSFDLNTRERKTIRHWEFEPVTDKGDIVQTFVSINHIAYDSLYYAYSRSVYDSVTQELKMQEGKNIRYDILSGEEEEFPYSFSCVGTAGYVGKSTDYVYDEQTHSDTLVDAFVYIRDRETLEMRKVVDLQRDNYQPTRDPAYCYGSYLSYQCDNTLFYLNADTGESKELVTPEDPIVNYWLMDHKIFYITKNENNISYFWYADLDEPIPVRLRNDDNTDYMVFSISYEGADFFADSNNRVISKEDFYAQNAT